MAGSHAPIPNQYTRFLSKVDVCGWDSAKCWTWRVAVDTGLGYHTIKNIEQGRSYVGIGQ